MARRALSVLITVMVLAGSREADGQLTPSPPPMPATGPGGYIYPHGGVDVNGPYWPETQVGNNNYRYIILEPADPKPESAPVVLFLHGYFARNPEAYMVWMQHMARKGYIVVWVQYDVGTTLPTSYLVYILETWEDALQRLENTPFESHVRPERDPSGEPRTAIVGHSIGAYLGMAVASVANDDSPFNFWVIPKPHALVLIEPGGWQVLTRPLMERIRPETRLLVVVGDEDDTVCKETALGIWISTAQIPTANKDFLFLRSDVHGEPAQIANHFFPGTTGFDDTAAVDGRDFSVTWKLSVGALNCVFKGADCAYAFGHGDRLQLDMGRWSDGVERTPLARIPDPENLETACVDVPVPDWGAGPADAATPGQPLRENFSPAANSLLVLALPVALALLLRRRSLRRKGF